MPPDSIWSNRFIKPEIQLDLRGVGWKNLMSECLLQTEIFKGNENKNGSSLSCDPNVVMNIRHELVKESAKSFPTPRGQVQSEALKLLRDEYHDRVVKHKQGKLVETEIVKLRQILENRRLEIRKKLQETSERAKSSSNRTKPIKWQRKPPKELGHFDDPTKNTWLGCCNHRTSESNITQNIPEKDIQVLVMKPAESPEFVSPRKGSLVEENGESESETEFWEEDTGKKEILKRFFKDDEKPIEIEEEITEEIIRKKEEDYKREEIIIKQAPDVPKRITEKGIGRVIKNWRNRKIEAKVHKNQIDEFLSKLKEKKKEEKEGALMTGNRLKRRILERSEKDEKASEKLKKLMQEVKESQKEAQQKLQNVKARVEIDTKFLLRMEERRQERAKRRKEFEDRKLKLEEEKENMERQREEEKRQRDEEEKRRRLEELKEKRRAEREKKEEQKRERERLRVQTGVAVSHYRVYLLRSYGLRPWMKVMTIREWQLQEAMKFFERRLQQKVLWRWLERTREQIGLKISRAEEFHENMVKKNCLLTWVEWHKRHLRHCQVALDWHDFKITERAFKNWLQYTRSEQSKLIVKTDIATEHYHRKLKVKYLKKLKDYPVFKRLEQEKENRKWKWRQKVKEILPDFEPVDITDQL